ncbi:N-acetylmuramoyl-L-alanine amidase family protein [Clostridium chromiireducens]|uniref:N-acetylmuramoyl-L-alanine amidase family protein n=1 Tax=Clostridium chromiireducens TaxID=225345 RepID=UPI003AF8090E
MIFSISIATIKGTTPLSYITSLIQNIDKSKSNNLPKTIKLEANPKQLKTIVIDPGHGGYDPGSIGVKGTIEKNTTLSISLKLGAILEKKGFNIIYTRESDNVTWPSDNKKDLAARADIANEASADIFISIHLNTFHMEEVRGTETYYNKVSTEGKEIAELIQNQIVKEVKSNDRGAQPGSFSVLRKVTAPAVLIELGYISNKSEESLLNSISYQNKMSQAIANGVYSYFNQ